MIVGGILSATMLSIRQQSARVSRRVVVHTRLLSEKVAQQEPVGKDGKKLTPEEARRQAAELAMQSLKDVGSLLSSNPDSAVQPIDTAPIWKDPTLFGPLSLLHQGQVTKELQERYDKNWNKLTMEDKKLGYYIAYGNWGVREKFNNWNTAEPPYDLPFKIPTQIKSMNPKSTTVIQKLEPVILAETPVRIDQFNYKKMDGVTKFFIYMTGFIIVFALYRDKKIGEAGKPTELIIEDPYEIERAARHEKELAEAELELERLRLKEQHENHNSKKWYYLWLK